MGVRVLRQADGEDERSLGALVATEQWRHAAQILKDDRDTTVYRGVDDAGLPIVVKRMVMRSVRRKITSRLGWSRLARQWRGSELLQAAGIATAPCRVLFRDRHIETLVLDWVDGATVAECCAHGGLSVRDEHAITTAIGVQVMAISRAGMFNRDHKASNLVVRLRENYEPGIVLIDTVGIRKGQPSALTMLAKTMIELIGIGAPPRRTLCMRALKAAYPKDTKSAWRAIAGIIYAHGDPAPKISPVSLRQ